MKNLIFTIFTLTMLALIALAVYLPAMIDAHGIEPLEVRVENTVMDADQEDGGYLMGDMHRIDPDSQRIFLHENARMLMKTVRSL